MSACHRALTEKYSAHLLLSIPNSPTDASMPKRQRRMSAVVQSDRVVESFSFNNLFFWTIDCFASIKLLTLEYTD